MICNQTLAFSDSSGGGYVITQLNKQLLERTENNIRKKIDGPPDKMKIKDLKRKYLYNDNNIEIYIYDINNNESKQVCYLTHDWI